jgi:hypothetical protein
MENLILSTQDTTVLDDLFSGLPVSTDEVIPNVYLAGSSCTDYTCLGSCWGTCAGGCEGNNYK